MDLYLTPERYRTMGWGVNLDDIPDVELRSALHASSALVNSYCAVPLDPQPYSFRGGVIAKEHSRYDMGTQFRPAASRVYVKSGPIETVTELKLIVTNTQYIAFDPSDLYVVSEENAIDIVSLKLTSVGVFGAAIVPNVGMRSPAWETSYTYRYLFRSTDEYLSETDAKVFRAMNQFWIDGEEDVHPIVVKKNGTELVLTTDYTLDTIEGTVTIVGDVTASDVFTVSYSYTLPPDISVATGLVCTTMIGERALVAKGMAGLAGLRVEEIDLRRSLNPLTRGIENTIPDSARALLEPYVFVTIR
jgi:hypothetical protein